MSGNCRIPGRSLAPLSESPILSRPVCAEHPSQPAGWQQPAAPSFPWQPKGHSVHACAYVCLHTGCPCSVRGSSLSLRFTAWQKRNFYGDKTVLETSVTVSQGPYMTPCTGGVLQALAKSLDLTGMGRGRRGRQYRLFLGPSLWLLFLSYLSESGYWIERLLSRIY